MQIGINALFLVKGKGGGLETYLEGLIGALKRLDTENAYLVFTNRDCRGALELGGNFTEVPCNISATRRVSKVLFEQLVFPSKLKGEGVDILISPANVAPARHSCPAVSVIHDMVPFERPEGFSTIERWTLKSLFYLTARTSGRVITVSEYSKRDIVKRFSIPPGKVSVIYEGLGKELVRPTEGEAERLVEGFGIERPYILCVASSRKYKNIDGLIRAFRILKEKRKRDELLVIAGHAEKAHGELVTLAGDLGLKDDILFTGFVEEASLAALYAKAAVFVYPSFFEGFGLPILEAFSLGAPVAASNAASIPEVAGDAALLFDPYKEEEMAASILKILRNKRTRESLVSKGEKRLELFTWDKTAAEVLGVINEVARR